MTPAGRMILADMVTLYGKHWRTTLSPPLQDAVIGNAALGVLLSNLDLGAAPAAATKYTRDLLDELRP